MSLKKIFTAIIGTMFLIHLKDILGGLQPFYSWLCDSLYEIRYFEEGAQATIAVTTIVLIVVLILRVFNRY